MICKREDKDWNNNENILDIEKDIKQYERNNDNKYNYNNMQYPIVILSKNRINKKIVDLI